MHVAPGLQCICVQVNKRSKINPSILSQPADNASVAIKNGGRFMYDQNNIFAKILRDEIPAKKIAQGQYYLSFYDIAPKAPIHALIIPTGTYQNAHEFSAKASAEEIVGFYKGVDATIDVLGLKADGYRLISNTGTYGRQDVPHFHIHILGGHDLGPKHAMTTFANDL